MPRRIAPIAVVAAAVAAVVAATLAWWWMTSNRYPPPPVPEGLAAATTTAAPLIRDAVRLVESRPGDAEARYHLALVYEANDDPTRARTSLEQAILLAPDAPPAWYHLALVHEHFGALDEAIAAMERVVELAPGYAPAHRHLGQWRLDQNRIGDAEKAFQRALAANPRDVEAAVGMARIEVERNDDAAALARLEAIVNGSDPPGAGAFQLYGTILRRAGRLAEAGAAFARARADAPQTFDPWRDQLEPLRASLDGQLAYARKLLLRGRVADALTLLESLYREYPESASAAIDLAVARRALGNLDGSMALLEDAVAAFPESSNAHYNYALTRFMLSHRPDGTIDPAGLADVDAHVATAIATNPSSPLPRALQGDLHTALGENRAAAACYQQAAVADPANPSWPYQAGLALLRAGDAPGALTALSSALALSPRRPEIMVALAEALRASGRADEAASMLAAARRQSSRRPEPAGPESLPPLPWGANSSGFAPAGNRQ
ncbi:MAG: tetratricopeptide repeat protein [Phycisphaerales bacterium]|nr:tetratricopeptide repeat protein [Phycisphaerales bacterium]